MKGVPTPTTPEPHDGVAFGEFRTDFGFKVGRSGAHTARTMMLADLRTLLTVAPEAATRRDFSRLISEENVLGKRTSSNRRLTARHLTDLYALDPKVTIFRLLRLFWGADAAGRPLLALLCAQARDALFRLSARKVLDSKPGELLTSADFMAFFGQELPGRFSAAMTLSLAQNVAASWAQAGFLNGRVHKVRTRAVATPACSAYALALGYLCGLRGQVLLESGWARLLDAPSDQVIRLAREAAQRGWLDFKHSGNVFEISFRQILTPTEIQASHGPD